MTLSFHRRSIWPQGRSAHFLLFAACAASFAFALYAQHVLGLEPCPLCVFQRVALLAVGGWACLGMLAPAGGWRRGMAAGALLSALAGAGIAGWHVRLQLLPAEQVPACGPGLEFMLETMPLTSLLKKVFQGSGECAAIDWTFLGASMPMWTAALFVLLAVYSLYLLLQRQPRRRLF